MKIFNLLLARIDKVVGVFIAPGQGSHRIINLSRTICSGSEILHSRWHTLRRVGKGKEIIRLQFKADVLIEISIEWVTGISFVLEPDKVMRLPVTPEGGYSRRAVNRCVFTKFGAWISVQESVSV